LGIVVETPSRLIVPWYVGQSPAAPDDLGAGGPDVAAGADPGDVAAGDAGPLLVHADSARIAIVAPANAACCERMPASVPSIGPAEADSRSVGCGARRRARHGRIMNM
jgi:hypothetical protein